MSKGTLLMGETVHLIVHASQTLLPRVVLWKVFAHVSQDTHLETALSTLPQVSCTTFSADLARVVPASVNIDLYRRVGVNH